MTKTLLILLAILFGNLQTFQPSNVPTCDLDRACTADCDPVWWWTAQPYRLICQVTIIDYYNVHYTFTADPTDSDYMVKGIGTDSLTTWRKTWAERIAAVSVYTRQAELQFLPVIH